MRRISDDWREIDVEMRLGLLNRNYMGSHFGGSLFSMSDPFFWLIAQRALPDYVVSHKGGRIDFLTPGYGRVRAEFRIPDATLDEIRAHAIGEERWIGEFSTEILNEKNEVVARATQTLHVRKRP